jgi:hypothetical protein
MPIELSHAHSLCAALGEHAPMQASSSVATSSRRRREARANAASACAALRKPPCFLSVSENRRRGAVRRAKRSPKRLAASRGVAECARSVGAEFQNDARARRIAIEFFLVTSVRFLSRARPIRDRSAT